MFAKFNDLTDSDKRTVLYLVKKERAEWAARQEERAKRKREYDKEVREWYTKGDGRPHEDGGLGFVVPCCIHGVSNWTDYDIPCWRCESGDGDDFEYSPTIRHMTVRWQQAKQERDKRQTALVHLVEAGYCRWDIPSEMTAWSVAPVVDILG